MQTPPITIKSSAPTRIADNGGWTDTWFAEFGTVFNIAIAPRAHVKLTAYPHKANKPDVLLAVHNFGDFYERQLGAPWQNHPLLEAAIEQIGLPDALRIQVDIEADAPPGASLGTSAAVTVALIGALDCLTPDRLSPYEIARQAWRVETEKLGRQCGIQDQLAAAFGGINLIEMHHYPEAVVTPVEPTAEILAELEKRLLVIYLGKPHDSSAVHEKVIARLEAVGTGAKELALLRQTAVPAKKALLAGNFEALGRTFIKNTEAQQALHPELVSQTAQKIIRTAQQHNVLGWKVNGAGGNGGSITLLLNDDEADLNQLQAALATLPQGQLIKPKLANKGVTRVKIQSESASTRLMLCEQKG